MRFLRWLCRFLCRAGETQSGMSTSWMKAHSYDRSGWEGPSWNFNHKSSYDWWKNDRS